MKNKLVILCGGNSSEREISLQSAKEVASYIDTEKYDMKIITLPKDKNTDWVKELIAYSPDIALNLLHGGDGENGSVTGLLNCLNIASIGNCVLSGAVCMNKNMCKAVLKNNGVPVCEDVFIRKTDDFLDFEEKIKELGFPVIVKPNNGGGSIGITISENIKQTKTAVSEIIENYNDDVIIEKFISGKEVTCVLVQKNNTLEIFPVLDISTNNKFYDYNAKYVDNTSKLNFSTLPIFMQKMIEDIAKKVFNIFECKDLCCVDLIVSGEQVYFIEVNTIPGFTSHSTVTRTLKALNISMQYFLDELIQNELKKHKN